MNKQTLKLIRKTYLKSELTPVELTTLCKAIKEDTSIYDYLLADTIESDREKIHQFIIEENIPIFFNFIGFEEKILELALKNNFKNIYVDGLIYIWSEKSEFNKKVILEAINDKRLLSLEALHSKFLKDKDIVLAAIKNNVAGYYYENLDEKLKENEEIALESFKNNFNILENYFPEKLIKNKEFMEKIDIIKNQKQIKITEEDIQFEVLFDLKRLQQMCRETTTPNEFTEAILNLSSNQNGAFTIDKKYMKYFKNRGSILIDLFEKEIEKFEEFDLDPFFATKLSIKDIVIDYQYNFLSNMDFSIDTTEIFCEDFKITPSIYDFSDQKIKEFLSSIISN